MTAAATFLTLRLQTRLIFLVTEAAAAAVGPTPPTTPAPPTPPPPLPLTLFIVNFREVFLPNQVEDALEEVLM